MGFALSTTFLSLGSRANLLQTNFQTNEVCPRFPKPPFCSVVITAGVACLPTTEPPQKFLARVLPPSCLLLYFLGGRGGGPYSPQLTHSSSTLQPARIIISTHNDVDLPAVPISKIGDTHGTKHAFG